MYLGTGKEVWLSSPCGDRFDEEILFRFPGASPPTYHIGVVGNQSKPFTIRVSRAGFPDGVTIITQKSSDAHDTWDARFDLKDLLYKYRHLYPNMRKRDPFYTILRPHWLFGAFSLLRVRVLPRDSDQGFDGAGYNLYFYIGSATHIPPPDDDLLRRFKNLSVYPSRDEEVSEKTVATEPASGGIAGRPPSSDAAPPSTAARFDPLEAARRARETQKFSTVSRTIAPRRDPGSTAPSASTLQASRPRAGTSVQGLARASSSQAPGRPTLSNKPHAGSRGTLGDAAKPKPKSVSWETPTVPDAEPSMPQPVPQPVPQPGEIAAASDTGDDTDDDKPLDQLIDPCLLVDLGIQARPRQAAAAAKRRYHEDDQAPAPRSVSSNTIAASTPFVRRSSRLQEKYLRDEFAFRLEQRPGPGPEFWDLWESIKDVPVTELLAREDAAKIIVFKNEKQEEDVKKAGREDMERRSKEKQAIAEEEEEYEKHPENFFSIEEIPLWIKQIVGDAIRPVRRDDLVVEIEAEWEDMDESVPAARQSNLHAKPKRKKKAITEYTSIKFTNKDWQRHWEGVLRRKEEREAELAQIMKDAVALTKTWRAHYKAAKKQFEKSAKKARAKRNAC